MLDKVLLILIFLAAGMLQISAFPVVWALFARAFRVGVNRYAVGFGPLLVRRGAFELRLIPLLGSVSPASRHVEESMSMSVTEAIDRGERRYFDDLPLGLCLVTALFMTVIGFVLTAAFLGFRGAAHATAVGIRDYISALLGPFSAAPRMLDEALRMYRESDFATCFGRALGIITSFQVLMIPSSVLGVLGMTTKVRMSTKINVLVTSLLAIAALIRIIEVAVWLFRG